MRREEIPNYINNNRSLIFGVFVISMFVIYSLFRKYQLDSHGVITIAKVVRYENAESGDNLWVKVYYNGQIYETMSGSSCYSCIGQFFFVRIVKGDPTGVVILYNDNPVPDCILQKPLPVDGWKEIPTCDDK